MRPANLPDYKAPPLNEVVLGVQFNPAVNYQQIRAGEVWSLYKANYPNVEEQPPLQPTFETFGGRSNSTGFQFGFVAGACHDRFWFLSSEKDELIQFQADRLLHNWRKVGDGNNEYPHFEHMIEKFQRELNILEAYFAGLTPQTLTITQCEVSYINHISLGASGSADEWLRFLHVSEFCKPDDISLSMRRALIADHAPWGRLFVDVNSGVDRDGYPMLQVTLTVRGAPSASDIVNSANFLQRGRGVIVNTFTEITTENAHEKWERIQ